MNINLFCEKAETIVSAVDTPMAEYAIDLIEHLKENADCYQDALVNYNLFKKAMLNGAMDWIHYSISGCSLCYDTQILDRLRLYYVSDKGIKYYKHKHNGGIKLLKMQAEQLRLAFEWLNRLRLELI